MRYYVVQVKGGKNPSVACYTSSNQTSRNTTAASIFNGQYKHATKHDPEKDFLLALDIDGNEIIESFVFDPRNLEEEDEREDREEGDHQHSWWHEPSLCTRLHSRHILDRSLHVDRCNECSMLRERPSMRIYLNPLEL